MARTKSERDQERMQRYGINPAGIKKGETLEHAYRRLAKQADQRLVRLEAAAREPVYKGVLTYAYGGAMDDIHHWSGDKANRFNTAPPTTEKELRAKINDITRFLNSPTSTKSGITKMYKARTETLNKKYGTNFTWQEAGRFFEQRNDKIEGKAASSDLVLKSIGKMQQAAQKVVADMEKSAEDHQVLSDAEINDAIYDQLEKNGVSAAGLLDEDEMLREAREIFDKEDTSASTSTTTAKKRTKPSAKAKKSRKTRKYAKRDYTGMSIAQIIRSVGQGIKSRVRKH